MKHLIYFCLLMLSTSIMAQQTFEFSLITDGVKFTSNAIAETDGSILAIISEQDSIAYHPSKPTGAYVLKFSSDGDTLTRHYTFSDTLINFNNIFKYKNEGYLLSGNANKHNQDTNISFIMRIDNLLNPLWVKWYSYESKSGFSIKRLFDFDDEQMVLVGELSGSPLQGSHPFFLRLDEQGNLIDSSMYHGSNVGRRDILLSPDSNYFWYISGSGLDPLGWSGRNVFDMDFNYVGGEIIAAGGDLHDPTALWHQDNKFLVGFNTRRPGVPYQDDELKIIQLDTSLNVTGSNYFGTPDTLDRGCYSGSTIDFRHPDSIYFAGFKNNNIWPPHPTTVSWIMVGQTDSLLQARFVHYIGGDTYYQPYYIVATSDGGCFVCAGKWSPEKYVYDLVFLKLNNEGLIVGDHPPGIAVKRALVYPNPATDMLKVETALRNASLNIYDINGMLKNSCDLNGKSTTIDLKRFAPGTYIYTITNNDGQVENGKFIKQ
ncbi:MAG: T9SS type A sorting domain-containing protein [Alphaproteobacteria bacterium]|nr:T9SS type A sorting domain-containing protein [Alphaproteobacteria bacterium]